MRTRFWLLAAGIVIGADQLAKWAATRWLEFAVPLPLVPHLNLTLLHNTGAAFSLLGDASGWQRWLFTGIAVIISAVIVWWLHTLSADQRWLPCALALVLGGALGNLIDRVRLGYVVDFIQVYHGSWAFPAFNLADSAISVGAAMLILHGTVTGRSGASGA